MKRKYLNKLRHYEQKLIIAFISVLAISALNFYQLKDYFTLEEFGGQAWYLPPDGRLQEGVQYSLLDFTPISADPSITKGLTLEGRSYTKITAKTTGDFFPPDIVDKRFCGLFTHQNPATPNYKRVDEFYPQEKGSLYATVVARIDGRNVLVDFEYNGGSTKTPQRVADGKGYFFVDNSQTWDKLRLAATSKANKTEEIKLQGFALANYVQVLYVIPEYQTWQMHANQLENLEWYQKHSGT